MKTYTIPSQENFNINSDFLTFLAYEKFYETSSQLQENFPQASLDFSKRPFLKTSNLGEWLNDKEEIADDDISTLYLTDYTGPDGKADTTNGRGPYFNIIFTPILDDGTILSEADVNNYFNTFNFNSIETILNQDSINKKIIVKVVEVPLQSLNDESWYEALWEQEWAKKYEKIKEKNLIAALYLMKQGELQDQNHLNK